MSRLFSLLSAFVLLSLVPLNSTQAQDDDVRVAGKVMAKSSTSITIATDDKKNPSITFVVNDKTQVRRARSPISVEAVEVGELAGVVGKKEGDQLLATVIETRAKP